MHPPPRTRMRLRDHLRSCSFFPTTTEFRPTLQAQHDDAAERGQNQRVTHYQILLTRLDDQTA